ncbi:MAG: bifunctional diaminohydroxyphosphoribosylaminopyrimidine deaminase/5-amino-6-(5-phosphoribosylamino)uracil reductase RibD [Chitinophagaceae bacterium]|nr:bifunctional diaminohydroxyphosphoribosylaminopyrimidine deaminase/5-amino-6-(5-phosphoribosylamino)uracil reductase RibD [Chitinophagaceae bacterium]
MHRCIHLAAKAAGYVAPNPQVGAVLVHDGKIIGEGWHKRYGEAHAEVNCISDAIQKGNESLLQYSVMYVSLEPCAHFGKTPPCADLIANKKIRKVVIGCRDPFDAVNGKGIERLQSAGIEVKTGVLGDECMETNKRFFTFHKFKKPYFILKWAETADGRIAGIGNKRLLISNEYTNRLVHKWRSEEAAILVGTNTAFYDNPKLTTRLWSGTSPVRIVIDKELRLPANLHLFDGEVKTIVLNSLKQAEEGNIFYLKLDWLDNLSVKICEALYNQNIQSVIVEGGTRMIQNFFDAGIWNEIRVIRNTALIAGDGLAAPVLPAGIKIITESRIGTDSITIYYRS